MFYFYELITILRKYPDNVKTKMGSVAVDKSWGLDRFDDGTNSKFP